MFLIAAFVDAEVLAIFLSAARNQQAVQEGGLRHTQVSVTFEGGAMITRKVFKRLNQQLITRT